MTPLSAIPIAAAALSLPLAWRTPAHRPLAVALVAAQALEAARPALPPELAWGALLALPALSAWAVAGTMTGARLEWGAAVFTGWALAWSLLIIAPWFGWWAMALGAAVAAQGAAWWRWRAERVCSRCAGDGWVVCYKSCPACDGSGVRAPSASEQAALVLAAGDASGLLVGLAAGWTAVGWWAAVAAAVLVGVQARALWRAWR